MTQEEINTKILFSLFSALNSSETEKGETAFKLLEEKKRLGLNFQEVQDDEREKAKAEFLKKLDALYDGATAQNKPDNLKEVEKLLAEATTARNAGDNEKASSLLTSAIQAVKAMLPQVFLKINQGEITNDLVEMIPGKRNKLEISGKLVKKAQVINRKKTSSGITVLTLSEYSEKNPTLIGVSALQLLDVMEITLRLNNFRSNEAVLPLEKFMQLRGLKDAKEAQKQAKKDLDALIKITLSAGGGKYEKLNIVDRVEVKDRKITVEFSGAWSKILQGYKPMAYIARLLTVNGKKNPHSFYLGHKICVLKNINIGHKNEDKITIKTLLDACPQMPTYENVSGKNGRHYKQQIYEPFFRDMDYFNKDFTYECFLDGKSITKEEAMQLEYIDFIRVVIKINWLNYPDQQARIQHKAEQKALEASKEENKAMMKAIASTIRKELKALAPATPTNKETENGHE